MLASNRANQQLEMYRLTRLLGESESSAVYLGEHLGLHIPVAIKVLSGRFTRSDQEKFLAQAHILSQLEHPHIVHIYDFGIENGTPFLVMSYAPHGNLRQRHPRGSRVPLERIVIYVKQVASALHYVHYHKLIHRDIKPHNMLLGPRGEILLSDFGIAITSHSIDGGLPGMSDFEGTVLYSAPEQLQGQPRRSSDQYALGVVVYEWLSGGWPFRGSFSEVARQHISDPPPSLKGKGIDIAPAVEEVVLKALAKDPHKRFHTVNEFAGALEQACCAELACSVQANPRRQFMSPLPFPAKASNVSESRATIGAVSAVSSHVV